MVGRGVVVVVLACVACGATPGTPSPERADAGWRAELDARPRPADEPVPLGDVTALSPMVRTQLPPGLAAFVEHLDAAMWTCPDRVWPGLGRFYREDTQVLLVDAKAETAILWNDRGLPGVVPTLAKVPWETLGPAWKSDFFAGVLNGTRTLGVNVTPADGRSHDEPVPVWEDRRLALVLHESFHFQGSQRTWAIISGEQTRAIPYPERWEPRYLRAEMVDRLLLMLATDAKRPLGPTSGLLRSWRAGFADEAEALRTTDVREGSAQYATAVSLALADLGCGASDDDLLATLRLHVAELAANPEYDGLVESYALGMAAGLVLRARGVSGWEAAVEAGVPPLDVLVYDVPPMEAPRDEALARVVAKRVGERNQRLAAELDPMLARLQASDHVRLPLPFDWLAGSFSTRGFVRLVEQPGTPEVVLALEGTYVVPGRGRNVTVVSLTVPEDLPNPCGVAPRHVVAAVPAASVVEQSPGSWRAEGTVRFDAVPAELRRDEAGRAWLCVGAVP